jgi:hypothetical protein
MSQSLLLYNQVIATAYASFPTGAQQTANDTGSQTQYWIRTLRLPTVESRLDSDVLGLCNYLVGRYSQPEIRFATLTVELQSLPLIQQQALLALDIGSMVWVKRTPPGSGTPATIAILSQVEQITAAFDSSNSSFTVTFGFGSVDLRPFFIVGSATQGLLNTGILNY